MNLSKLRQEALQLQKALLPIDYSARQRALFSRIPDGVAIIPANRERMRNPDVHYKFRQDSHFHYLTGFDEPDAIAVFRHIGGECEFILFVRPRDRERELWDGRRSGVEGAIEKFGADRAYPLDEFSKRFGEILSGAERVFYRLRSETDSQVLNLLEEYRRSQGRSGRGLLTVHDVQALVGEMRLFKTEPEIQRLRVAGKIGAYAHGLAMSCARAGINEGRLEGLIDFAFRDLGCARNGYGSIVASGENATILHYVDNQRDLQDGELLLIDAGCEFGYYTSDITRTFPVGGRFSKEQATLYQLVLDTQLSCLELAKPGATLAQLHDHAVKQLTQGLLSLKLLEGSLEQNIKSLAFKRYYPHGTGHLLGMDVHDVGLYMVDGAPRPLAPGMCFTVEPGLYVQEYDNSASAAPYKGIGIRIEDDVLVTSTGIENLTGDVPKDMRALEALVGTSDWPL